MLCKDIMMDCEPARGLASKLSDLASPDYFLVVSSVV